MSRAKGNDLANDPISSLLRKLALPAIAAQMVNALYSIVDRMYIGHISGSGDLALTGVGVSFPILMIISSFSALVAMGGGPRASIEMGRGNNAQAERILGSCIAALLLNSVVLTAVFLWLQKPMLLLFGASEKTLPFAMDYLTIYLWGTIFVQLELGLNYFITIQGFATTSMLTVFIGAFLNIILDPIFIFGLNMGVKGAAVATVISQAVTCVWVIAFLFGKKTHLHVHRKNIRLNKSILMPVLALGLSPFIMQATESAVSIALNVSLQKYGGDIAVGAMTICTSVMQVAFMPAMGLSQGAQPIISFNYGAGKSGRVKEAFRLVLIYAFCSTFIIWLCIMIFPTIFVHIFNDNQQLTNATVKALRVVMACSAMMGIQIPCQQTFVALGEAKISLLLALLRKVILLIPLIYILPCFFTNKVFAVFLAEPIADFTAAACTAAVFFPHFKKLMAECKS